MKTHITFVLDSSGSMSKIEDDTKGGFNTFLREQRDEPGTASVTLYEFNTNVDLVYRNYPIEDAPELDAQNYTPSGRTALHDAIYRAVTETADHVFASADLNATEATYLHEYDDLSDHTPLEVVFTPRGGLHEDVGMIDRSTYTPPTGDTDEQPDTDAVNAGLTYDEDIRMVDPDANYRRGRFKIGWNKAVDGDELDADVLEQLTWENLGWRLGKLFGPASDDLQEALYEWCVDQQVDEPT